MTERRPLVIIAGVRQELPVGDTLMGAGGGSTPTRVLADQTLAVGDYSQVVMRLPITLEAGASIEVGEQSALVSI